MCAVLLAIFNQLSGINAINYYAPMPIERAGASTGAVDATGGCCRNNKYVIYNNSNVFYR